ncbi:MAG: HD domain-containing protein [Spirochaetaceae bacterium]|nr:MAG: HD domain-containing protein [Spirochaetaceae bacterium]
MDHHKVYATLNSMLEQPRLQKVYQSVRDAFEAHGNVGHGWEHVRRVIVNAAWIGSEENADLDIVMPAIILHDIGFVTHPDQPKQHPEHGAAECHRFLDAWTEEQRVRIAQCILTHKAAYPGYAGLEPQSLEERVVCDADQLDKFGWIGVTQMIKVYVEYGIRGLERYKRHSGIVEGLRHLSKIRLYTETGKRIAAERSEPAHLVTARRLEEELSLSENWREAF